MLGIEYATHILVIPSSSIVLFDGDILLIAFNLLIFFHFLMQRRVNLQQMLMNLWPSVKNYNTRFLVLKDIYIILFRISLKV